MSRPSQPRSASERLYRVLLGLYPARFRQRFGFDMVQLFRDYHREAGIRPNSFARMVLWCETLFDLVVGTLQEHLREFRQRPGRGSSRSRGDSTMSRFWQDVRFAFRMLSRNPGMTAAAVLSLALGIGANTAIFSMVNAVFLRPLPYPQADRLVMAGLTLEMRDGSLEERDHWSYAYYQEFSRGCQGCGETAAFYAAHLTLTGLELPQRVKVGYATASYFSILGVHPSRGRAFAVQESSVPGESPVALLSDRLWQRLFGGDTSVLGRDITLEGHAFTVAGILPAGFEGLSGEIDLWVPFTMADVLEGTGILGFEHYYWHYVVARLQPGVTLESARASFPALGEAMRRAVPSPRAMTPWATPLREAQIDPQIHRPLGLLLAAVAFVLLIACANVANLLLSRTAARSREVAVRRAIGASQGRLLRQFLTESLLLGLLGGAAGLLLAWLGIRGLTASLPQTRGLWTSYAQAADFIRIDWTVLGFTLAASLAGALLFGLAPAFSAWRFDVRQALAVGAWRVSGASGSRRRLTPRNLLLVSQLALALVLLTGAGLMLRSLYLMRTTDSGIRAEGLLTARFQLSGDRYEDQRQFYLPLLDKVRALPAVESASLASTRPLGGSRFGTFLTIEGRDAAHDDYRAGRYVLMHVVESDYLQTLEIPLLEGRNFESADRQGAVEVALVNRAAAQLYWPGESPLGKRIGVGIGRPGSSWFEVVGVVGDVRYESVEQEVGAEVYHHYLQLDPGYMTLYLRSAHDSLKLVPALRAAVRELDSQVAVYAVRPQEEISAASMSHSNFLARLLGLFAIVALILAGTGIYGVMAFQVSGRRRELGIRMALGAERRSVLWMVLRRGLAVTAAGALLGLFGAAWMSRFLESQLYQTAPGDPGTLVLVTALLGLVALLAAYLPARRAARSNPVEVLRSE